MSRGICTTVSVPARRRIGQAKGCRLLEPIFGHRLFRPIFAREGEFPDVPRGETNRIDLSVTPTPRGPGRHALCSAEDNLIKGAGGQAIQSMSVCQGYEEGAGLR